MTRCARYLIAFGVWLVALVPYTLAFWLITDDPLWTAALALWSATSTALVYLEDMK